MASFAASGRSEPTVLAKSSLAHIIQRDNGTTITDAHYLSTGEKRPAHQMKRSKFANWAVGRMGNMVMGMDIPIYRRWKTHYADLPDYVFILSDT